MSYGLAIHTSSPELGLALSNFAGDRRSQVWQLGRDKSAHMHGYLAAFMHPQSWADLAFLAVARGPGGFTGTRIGVVTARTLAQQLEIPLFAVSSLAAVAWFHSPEPGEVITVQMPAQRGEVYGAIYQVATPPGDETPHETHNEAATIASSRTPSLITLLTDTVLPLDSWQDTIANWQTPYRLVEAEGDLGNTVSSVLDLAFLEWQQGKRPHWSEALPYYGQHPVRTA